MSLSHLPLLLLFLFPVALSTQTPYNLQDLSSISLYSTSAQFNPRACPPHITFSHRAIYQPSLHKIILPAHSFHVEGIPCKADIPHFIFKPIGSATDYPPQWLFEDSTYRERPVNFTCAQHQFSIRFGYFNDVDTTASAGVLDPKVMYFDFAVFPYTSPFSFCSFAAQRLDGQRPLDFAPFPTSDSWQQMKNHGKLPSTSPPST